MTWKSTTGTVATEKAVIFDDLIHFYSSDVHRQSNLGPKALLCDFVGLKLQSPGSCNNSNLKQHQPSSNKTEGS